MQIGYVVEALWLSECVKVRQVASGCIFFEYIGIIDRRSWQNANLLEIDKYKKIWTL